MWLESLVIATSKSAFCFAGHKVVLKALMLAKHQWEEWDLWLHTGMFSIPQEVCRTFDLPTKCMLDLRLHWLATSSFTCNIIHYDRITFWQVCLQEMHTNAS